MILGQAQDRNASGKIIATTILIAVEINKEATT
jgi:hypothetical protein